MHVTQRDAAMTRFSKTAGTIAAAILIAAAGRYVAASPGKASDAATIRIPAFEYDATWPKPLPHNWTMGNVGAVYVDSRDHVWVLHRPATTTGLFERYGLTGEAECCFPAPPVIELDQAGSVVQAWGPIHGSKGELLGDQVWGPYPDVPWPNGEHGIFADDQYVWLDGFSAPSPLLKFTRAGKFVMRIGKEEGKSSNDTTNLAGPTQMIVDPQTNELFLADGYRNRRVIVFDAQTGAYKRHWGAYGHKPPDVPQGSTAVEGGAEYEEHMLKGGKFTPFWLAGPDKRSQNFATVHCVVMSRDRLLYVCDRNNNRLQVFRPDGTFIKEGAIREQTLGSGSVYAIGFSPDQQFMYVADGTNKKVWILRRDDLKVLGSFGTGGRMGGQLMAAHALATDSKGNVYVGETVDNNRVQRFKFVGMKIVPVDRN
jgi:hypothetical protein